MRSICIIPARGGSKRIPRKNIKDFLGKPIIAYSIETALESELFDEVMVSTDDEEIAEVALEFGAKVPFMRSEKNADDHATTVDVLVEVLRGYRDNGRQFEYGCCIYPCTPLLQVRHLKSAFDLMVSQHHSSVLPVQAFSFPVQRAFRMQGGKLAYTYPEHEKTRSQDLEQHYHDSGMFYWFRSEALMTHGSLIGSDTGCILLSEQEAQDIDTLDDWKMAELKYKLRPFE